MYYLYHLPKSRSTGKSDYTNRKLVGEYNLIIPAKGAARRFIGKGSKMCIITSKPPTSAKDILYIVQYQDGSKFWKDPEIIKERTGWVFLPV